MEFNEIIIWTVGLLLIAGIIFTLYKCAKNDTDE